MSQSREKKNAPGVERNRSNDQKPRRAPETEVLRKSIETNKRGASKRPSLILNVAAPKRKSTTRTPMSFLCPNSNSPKRPYWEKQEGRKHKNSAPQGPYLYSHSKNPSRRRPKLVWSPKAMNFEGCSSTKFCS